MAMKVADRVHGSPVRAAVAEPFRLIGVISAMHHGVHGCCGMPGGTNNDVE
jgi:hypothetical protein